MSDLVETLADVAALVPRFSWTIMDDDQRDQLMEKVVLPRYGRTTADGVKLGPTAWAEMLGASAKAITDRVYRLKQSQKGRRENLARDNRVKQRSHARMALQEADPEEIRAIIEDPATRLKVQRALAPKQSSEPRERPDPSFISLVVTVTGGIMEMRQMVDEWHGPQAIPEELNLHTFVGLRNDLLRIEERIRELRNSPNLAEFQRIVADLDGVA